MKYLIPILLILQSCQAYKNKICLTCATKTIIKDSIVTKIEERTKEVRITDTVKIRTYLPSPCDKMCDPKTGQLIKGFTADLKSDKGTDTKLYEKDGELAIAQGINDFITKGVVKDTTVQSFHNERVEVPVCHLEHLDWWDKFWIGLGKGLSALVGLTVIGFVAKKYFLG